MVQVDRGGSTNQPRFFLPGHPRRRRLPPHDAASVDFQAISGILPTNIPTSVEAELSEVAADKPKGRVPKGGVKTRLRTLADVDRRTRAAQDAFDLRDRIAEDLGGMSSLSAMEREIVDNAALLGAILKDATAGYLTGEAINLQEVMAAMNAQRRLLETLGLARRARDVTPSLRTYLASREVAA